MHMLLEALRDLARALVRLADRLPGGPTADERHQLEEILSVSERLTRRIERIASVLAKLDAKTPAV